MSGGLNVQTTRLLSVALMVGGGVMMVSAFTMPSRETIRAAQARTAYPFVQAGASGALAMLVLLLVLAYAFRVTAAREIMSSLQNLLKER